MSLSKWSKGDTSLNSSYIYGNNAVENQKTGLIYGVKLNGTQQLGYEYDELSRLQRRLLYTTTPFATEYTYLEGASADTTTTLVKTIKNGNDILEYTYDEIGNITSVSKNGTIIEQYAYDALGQLISATYSGNTYTYSYDNGGNLTEIKKNGETIKTYTYGNSEWTDQLTGFNGETITYDAIGNPLTYRGGMNFTWQNGRQLASVTQNGSSLATYTYDGDGLRNSKTVNGITTEYYWQNGTLYGQKSGDESIFYLYDENGSAYGFIYKNLTEQSHYYYEFNLQGDIIGIIDSTGTRVVEYTYGAWGDTLSITGTLADTIGQKNPLRYRGYYYDAETGFYATGARWMTITLLGTVSVLLIAGSALFIRQHFIPFNSPESAYKYVYGGETFIVVEGIESDYIIGNKDAKYLNKSKKGWTVPIINISIAKGMKRIDSTTIYVSQYNFSDEYYLTISDSENNSLDVKDNRDSTFYKFNDTNQDSQMQSCVYYTYVNKIDSDYVITVNGEAIKLCE